MGLQFSLTRGSMYFYHCHLGSESKVMKLKIIIYKAEEGGYWAEVPAIVGCATQGDTFEELLENIYEAIEGCLSVEDIK